MYSLHIIGNDDSSDPQRRDISVNNANNKITELRTILQRES